MAIAVVTPPTTSLLSTPDRLAALVDADATQAVALAWLLQEASSAIARYCGRTFGRATVAESLDAPPGRFLQLSWPPVVSVSSITPTADAATAITEWTIEDADAGLLYRAAGWHWWGTGQYWPPRLTVTYVAGYILPPTAGSTLPKDVEHAALELAAGWWVAQGTGGQVRRQQSQDLALEFFAPEAGGPRSMPPAIAGLLAPYRRGAWF